MNQVLALQTVLEADEEQQPSAVADFHSTLSIICSLITN